MKGLVVMCIFDVSLDDWQRRGEGDAKRQRQEGEEGRLHLELQRAI
jgi:hypothetical protein